MTSLPLTPPDALERARARQAAAAVAPVPADPVGWLVDDLPDLPDDLPGGGPDLIDETPTLTARAQAAGWVPVDLAAVIRDGIQRPTPTVGIRPDGAGGLFYPGRRHTIVAESEAGKSWLAQHQAVCEARSGQHVLYIDFEDDEHGFAERMLAIGIETEHLLARVHYYRPDAPIGPMLWPVVDQLLGDLRPTLAIVDGITDGMALHGLNPLDNRDVALFSRLLLRPIADRGPATATLDHVTKAVEGRGRHALGGVHKLNDVSGHQIILDNRAPFGRDMTGRSSVLIAKDRPGYLRATGRRTTAGLYWVGDLVGESLPGGGMQVDLTPPPATVDRFRPTHLMDKVRAAVEGAPGPLSQRDICDRVTGKAADVRLAIACLVDEGTLVVEQGPRGAKLHTLAGTP